MYVIAVYNEREELIGFLTSRMELTPNKLDAAKYSSEQTAKEVGWSVEESHGDWYTEATQL